MIISNAIGRSKEKPIELKRSDLINGPKFNSLPSPVTAKMIGGGEWWIESLCVETGFLRLDVCGQIDLGEFCMVSELVGSDGATHNPDDFYNE